MILNYQTMKDTASKLLTRILDTIGFEAYEIEFSEPRDLVIQLNVSGLSDRDTALLIGRQGEVLQALQFVLRTLLREEMELLAGEERQLVVDVMNYRQRQIDHLTIMAKKKAREAMLENKDVSLRPMSPYERRIVHMALKDETGIATQSLGEEPNRYIVIKVLNEAIEI